MGTFQWAFLALLVAINVSVGSLVAIFKLPVYVDSIGTFLAAALGGWLYGAATGVLSVIVAAITTTPTAPAYAGTAIIIALVVSLLVKVGFLRKMPMTIIGGVIVGIVSAIVSSPVTTYLYGGVSLAGADAATAFFKATGKTLLESVVLGGLATDPVDKIVTSVVAYVLLRSLPRKVFLRFRNGKLFSGEE